MKTYDAIFKVVEYFSIPIEANTIEEAIEIANGLHPSPRDYEIEPAIEANLCQMNSEDGLETVNC